MSDEAYEKIRQAFDAYIFLSYRKKDRKHAQEIMSRIHENDFMRDIAIWYDENLTPGRDFNDEIFAIMNKSDIFEPLLPESNQKKSEPDCIIANKSGKPVILKKTKTQIAEKIDENGTPSIEEVNEYKGNNDEIIKVVKTTNKSKEIEKHYYDEDNKEISPNDLLPLVQKSEDLDQNKILLKDSNGEIVPYEKKSTKIVSKVDEKGNPIKEEIAEYVDTNNNKIIPIKKIGNDGTILEEHYFDEKNNEIEPQNLIIPKSSQKIIENDDIVIKNKNGENNLFEKVSSEIKMKKDMVV